MFVTSVNSRKLLIFLRILANVLVLMLLALSTYIIQVFVARSRKMEEQKLRNPSYVADFWTENEVKTQSRKTHSSQHFVEMDSQIHHQWIPLRKEGRKEMFYLTTHSTHFIYCYMASEETCCRHMGFSFRLAANVLLYATSHREDDKEGRWVVDILIYT